VEIGRWATAGEIELRGRAVSRDMTIIEIFL
jgi:hypothetical protein